MMFLQTSNPLFRDHLTAHEIKQSMFDAREMRATSPRQTADPPGITSIPLNRQNILKKLNVQ